MRWLIGATALALATPAAAKGDDGLSLSGTMRLRYETIANQPRTGFNRDDDLLNLRTTLLARYRTGGWTLAAELWDSRVYGQDGGTPVTTGEVNAIEPVQAYIGYRGTVGTSRIALQAGRMALNIASRRLVAADDYRNTTTGYTGLKADLAMAKGFSATAIYVLPQQRLPDDRTGLRHNSVAFDRERFDLVLWGATVARADAIGPLMAEATFYHLGEHDRGSRATRDRSLDTYGGRLLRAPRPGRLDGEIEALYQSGSISASLAPGASRIAVSAGFVHLAGGYSFVGSMKARLSFEYDWVSGDRAGGRYGRFDTLFGQRRGDFAPAGLYNAVTRANISTPGMRLEIAPSRRWDALATYHPMWLAERSDAFSTTGVRDAAGRSSRFAGHQFDARLRWWLRQDVVRFEFDGVMLTKGRFLRDAPNAPAGGTTAYAAFNLSAAF